MAYDKKNVRRREKLQYRAPETPRTFKSKKLKEFVVSEKAAITDNQGVKRQPGEKIMLYEEQANHFANLGYLKLDLNFDDEGGAEIAKLRSELAELKREEALGTLGAGSDVAKDDAGETSEGASADGDGTEPSDGSVSEGDLLSEGASSRRRRRSTL